MEKMLQQTINRLSNLNIEYFITVYNEKHSFIVSRQFRENNGNKSITLKPVGCNKSPAKAKAPLSLAKNSVSLVVSVDHLIENKATLTNVIKTHLQLQNLTH